MLTLSIMRFDRNANLTLNIFHTVYPELYPKARSKQFMMHFSISFTARLAVLDVDTTQHHTAILDR